MISHHDCVNYYCRQLGGELPAYYQGRQQIGNGWFSNFFRAAVPIAKKVAGYLGKKALKTGAAVAQDIAGGENIKQSLRKRALETGESVRDDVMSKLQGGFGIKRKRKAKKVHKRLKRERD